MEEANLSHTWAHPNGVASISYYILKGQKTSMSAHQNRVILVGTLVNVGRRKERKEAKIERRNTTGAIVESFGLEIVSPFGDACTIPLEASSQTEGGNLLTREQVGKPIAVEGVLRRRIHVDRRYAVKDDEQGARMVETQVRVSTIRAPREDEPTGISAVWITGKVLTPPRVSAHRTVRDTEIARTIVQVTLKRPSAYPGSKAMMTELMEAVVVLPLGAEGANSLYKPCNVVAIEGQIDMTLIPQAQSRTVQQKLTALDAQWTRDRQALEQSSENEQERQQQLRLGLRRYRNQRAASTETPLLTVVAGYVELIEGQVVSDDDVSTIVEEGRMAARSRRRISSTQRRQNPGHDAGASDDMASEPTETESMQHAVPTTITSRPRRRPGALTAPSSIDDSAANGMPVASTLE